MDIYLHKCTTTSTLQLLTGMPYAYICACVCDSADRVNKCASLALCIVPPVSFGLFLVARFETSPALPLLSAA